MAAAGFVDAGYGVGSCELYDVNCKALRSYYASEPLNQPMLHCTVLFPIHCLAVIAVVLPTLISLDAIDQISQNMFMAKNKMTGMLLAAR